jgi:hypothetical protein
MARASRPWPVLALALLALSSCVNYEERFTISVNGGGSIESTITMKESLADGDGSDLKRELESVFASTPGLKLAAYEVRNEGKMRVTSFRIDFSHVRDLQAVVGGEGGAEMARFFGTFTAEKQPDRYVMTRTIDLSDGIDGKNPLQKKGVAKAVAESVLANYTFTYHMIFPTSVIGANADSIEPSENRVTWRIPLRDALRGPVEMRAEVRRPPLLKWALIGGGTLLGLGLFPVVGLLLRRRNRLVPAG